MFSVHLRPFNPSILTKSDEAWSYTVDLGAKMVVELFIRANMVCFSFLVNIWACHIKVTFLKKS